MGKLVSLFTVALALPSFVYASGGDGYGHGWSRGGGHMMGFGYGNIYIWLISLVLIGVIIYLIIQNVKLKGSRETPLEILKKRYAKGEITRDEFEIIKKDIKG